MTARKPQFAGYDQWRGDGSGVEQGPVSSEVVLPMINAVVDNEPERLGGTSAFPRPKPTDPGGTNDSGWMKVTGYPSAGSEPSADHPSATSFAADSGPWLQVGR